MKRIILILLALTLFACAPTQYHDYRDYKYSEEKVSQEMVFSDDPLLNSIYRDRYLEMLRRCGSGKDECRKGR